MSTVVRLADAQQHHGGKAAALGALIRAGFAVPAGVVIPLPRLHGWRDRLPDVVDDVLAEVGPGPYAVRSSGTAEDGREASFAGQFRTILNVAAGADLLHAVAAVADPADSSAPAAYAARLGRPTTLQIPVIVQQMVPADVAGVMFTRDPVTGTKDVVIEAIRGLGVSLVDGSTRPERWAIGAEIRIAQRGDGSPVLTHSMAAALAARGRRIAALVGGAQDIEWAIASGRIWIVQTRPVTSAGPITDRDTGTAVSPSGHDVSTRPVVVGIPASPGRAVGTPRVIDGLDQFGSFEPGGVLVCHATSPAWTPLLARACAVVTETGGILTHAAIVAREFGIPAVVAATDATTRMPANDNVIVDGGTGTVTAALPAREIR